MESNRWLTPNDPEHCTHPYVQTTKATDVEFGGCRGMPLKMAVVIEERNQHNVVEIRIGSTRPCPPSPF